MSVLLLFAACSGGQATDTSVVVGPGGETPAAAVEQLLEYLDEGEFGSAASLAIPNQAALATLAEGASVAEVAAAMREGDAIVAANFWSGFAQSIADVLDNGPTVAGTTEADAEGTRFDVVQVLTVTGGERQLITRDVDGYRIDIFATFGPALATKLYSPIERLLSSPIDDAILVLSEMKEQLPSLYMAAQTPGLAPSAVQEVLRLIELISRVN
jgi:hypothetical protein